MNYCRREGEKKGESKVEGKKLESLQNRLMGQLKNRNLNNYKNSGIC